MSSHGGGIKNVAFFRMTAFHGPFMSSAGDESPVLFVRYDGLPLVPPVGMVSTI
jgi:hypothetical protein